MNIKDPEAHRLAQELAKETGQSMTKAVVEALRNELSHITRRKASSSRKADLLTIARRFRSRVKGPVVDLEELLYDEKGLPK